MSGQNDRAFAKFILDRMNDPYWRLREKWALITGDTRVVFSMDSPAFDDFCTKFPDLAQKLAS